MLYQDFAILYRTNAQSRIFEESLRKRNIPYKVYGGLSFYQRKEIKDLLSYLRLIVNNRDDEAFRRIINYPARGIGDTTIGKLEEYAENQKTTLFEVASNLAQLKIDINKGTQNKINQFVTFIRQFSQQIKTMDAYEVAYQVAMGSGIINDLKQEKTPENISRFENIEELLNSIREFTSQNEIDTGPLTLEQYLENVALLTDADTEKPEDTDKVTVMTMHSAKGLEFRVVYIVGIEEELVPSYMSLSTLEGIEEERRLFYVALTRAKEKAFLMHSENRYRWGNLTHCTPSRFLSEIDEEYLDLPEENNSYSPDFEMPDDNGWTRKPRFRRSENQVSERKPMFPQSKKFVKIEQAETQQPIMADFQADEPSKIQVGMQVLHERFGSGKVIQLEGNMPNVKATVFFPQAGQKQLLLKFAKLKILN